MPDRVTGFILGIVTVTAAVIFSGGIIEGAAHTRAQQAPNGMLTGWLVALDQAFHGSSA